jgi:hypothetical protein
MTSAFLMTSKLVRTRIERLLAVAATLDQLAGEPVRFVRLAAAALDLVQQHAIDEKGRCRFCVRRRRWRRFRARPCTVYAAFSAYLIQPDGLVQRQIAELTGHHPDDATARTTPMPRLTASIGKRPPGNMPRGLAP